MGLDSPDRAWLEAALMRSGVRVAACSAAELAAMPDVVPPSLAFLDDASSYGARMDSLATLLAHPGMRGVPVVVLARDADIESFSAALAHGAAAYLVKPAAEAEVLAVARRISAWLAAGDPEDDRHRTRRPLVMGIEVAGEGRASFSGFILDVGGGGCRVELPVALEEGELVRLTLHGVQGPTDLTLSARVRWRRQGQGGAEVAGLRFTGTAAVLAERLFGRAGGASA